MIENIGFRNEFINRYADELNSRFLPTRVSAHIDSLAQRISSEIVRHYSRWGGDINSWTQQVNNMKNFGNLRPLQAKGHIRSTFNLPAFHPLTITIDENTWTGDYFQSVPFAVEAFARPGYVFSHWESSQGQFSDVNINVNISGPMSLQPVFLFNPSADLVLQDEVAYLPYAPWPVPPGGQGPTLELLRPELDNSLAENWANNDAYGSPGAENFLPTTITRINPLVQFQYFPNPFTDQVNLQFRLLEPASVKITLYDARGVVVHTLSNKNISSGVHAFTPDLTHLSDSLYFLEMRTDNQPTIIKRWVKI